MSGTVDATDLLPAGAVYSLPGSSTIEISMPGGAVGGGHPLHLHGVSNFGCFVINRWSDVLFFTARFQCRP